MKRNAIVRIVIFSITILVLLAILVSGLLYSGLTNRFLRNSEQDYSSYTSSVQGQQNTVPAEQIQVIEIEWVAGTIIVQPGDVDTITFSESEVTNDKYAMIWKQSENKLSIQFCTESISFSGISIGNVPRKNLFITVPRDWQGTSLEIDGADARLEVHDLTIREVEIDSASGTCYFNNCTVDTLDLDTASGDVEFYGSLNVLECDAASANFTAVLTNVPSRMEMDLMSGDMDVTLPENCGFTASIDAMSSDFSSDFETTKHNGNYVHGDGSCRINVSAMSGDIVIRKAAPSASGTLHTHTEHVPPIPAPAPIAPRKRTTKSTTEHKAPAGRLALFNI